MKRLKDLNPHWIATGGEGVTNSITGEPVPRREAVAIGFDCPCGCTHPVCITLANPLDGGEPFDSGHARPRWTRTGADFETLTLTPSIQRVLPNGCWHGFVTNGEIITC